MSLTSGKFRWLTAVAVGALVVAGCSKSGLESSFVYSDKTGSLIPEAQNGVKGKPASNRSLKSTSALRSI